MTAEPYPFPELAEATVGQLQVKLQSREVTVKDLAEMHLERIHALNSSGPRLRAMIELNPEALDIAERLDRERNERSVLGPLHGIPVVIKDNIDTGDQMLTTAGSLALAGAPALADAALVARLRNAGLVLLGKTNLSEWANFRSTRSSSGWSGRGRQTLNPYVLDRSPSGSSSGSAVAVSAGMAPVAVGTETDGSIISPSSTNGIVGFKPTVGRISGRGIVPIGASQDTAGPLARSVADAALLYACLVGRRVNEFGLDPGALEGRRVGVLRTPFTNYSEHTDHIYETALVALRDAGAELIDPVELSGITELRESGAEKVLLRHEFKEELNAYLASRRGLQVTTLEDVIEFNIRHEDQEMPYFRQEVFEKAQATNGLAVPEYVKAVAQAKRLARDEGIDAVIAQHNLDALVAPSGQPAWVIDLINGDRYVGGSADVAAIAGYPSVTVPAGVAFGHLPVGISLFTRPEREEDLLRMAHAFEQMIQARRPPQYVRTLELP